jgi:hypothetical protein
LWQESEAALATRAYLVLLVTGHAHEQVSSALDGLMLERVAPEEMPSGALGLDRFPDFRAIVRGKIVDLEKKPFAILNQTGAD